MTKKNAKSNIFVYIFLALCALIWLFPIIIAFVKSFNINGLGNYKYVLSYEKISYFRVIANSMIIAIVTAVIVALITTLAAFAFSKMKFRGNKILYGAILACLAVPVAAVTSPLFDTIKRMGLLDSRLGVIVPLVAFNAPMMLLMIKNYFDTIPDELLESARMDGASTPRIWYEFMVPLSIPIIANVLVLTFIYSWNDYLVPLLVMRSEENYTVRPSAEEAAENFIASKTACHPAGYWVRDGNPLTHFLQEDNRMAYRVKAYTLREESTESGTRYFISFKDGQGKSHELEVSEQFFMEFRQMERRNRNLLQWDERHREFNEVWDETLYRRALRVPKSLDERMIEEERNETLCKAVGSLPEIQRRRFLLYYEYEFNFYQIAAMEHCTASAIQKSVAIAKEKVKAEMKKYLQP